MFEMLCLGLAICASSSVILTGDDEIARRPLQIGPAEVFRA